MTVDLLIISTNKYIKFLPKLLTSVHKYFLKDCDVRVHIFTDRVKDCEILLSQEDCIIQLHEIEHKPWPASTLFRFHFFKQYIDSLTGHYICYIDADTEIKAPIESDILSPRTVVQHCGFVNGNGTFEERKESRAYTPKSIQRNYYGGGFFLFDRSNFNVIVDRSIDMIDEDLKNGIMPRFHDESILNALMASMEPTKVLNPSYHFPEDNERIYKSWPEMYECKILLLNKDHKEIRS